MDEDTASRFVSSLVKSIQALCNGYIDFSTSIEVIGHIHLNIDRNKKLDYVLTEEVSKSVSEGSTVFASHSYHSQPPPSVSVKSANDSSNRHRQKVTSRDDSDRLGLTSLPHEVPNSSKSDSQSHNSSRVNDSGSFHSGSASSSRDSEVKQRNSPSYQDSSESRRRSVQSLQRNPSPAAKRSRTNDSGSRQTEQEASFDVIEIKEEPDEEPSVYFGDSSSHAGQDIQAPDFSNVVMESLDRVGQVEGTQLVSGGGGDGLQMQQPPFPVMLHSNAGMSSPTGPVPGPSDPQTAASTSGASPYSLGGYAEQPEFPQQVDLLHHSPDVEIMAALDGETNGHFVEIGEGYNHRCAVCERRRSEFHKRNPLGTPNPFKRKKTRYRCSVCKVYLCTPKERQCWWLWHEAGS